MNTTHHNMKHDLQAVSYNLQCIGHRRNLYCLCHSLTLPKVVSIIQHLLSETYSLRQFSKANHFAMFKSRLNTHLFNLANNKYDSDYLTCLPSHPKLRP